MADKDASAVTKNWENSQPCSAYHFLIMNLSSVAYLGNFPPIYLYLIFLNLYLRILIFELDLLSILNLIFAGYTGSRNQV